MMMTDSKIVAVMIAVLVTGVLLGAEEGKWVTDWPNLSEIGHIVKSIKLEGAVEDKKGKTYSVNVETKTMSSGELQKNAGMKYYGLNRRGPDVLNPLIGERMEMVFW
jgi:hypothetical protein